MGRAAAAARCRSRSPPIAAAVRRAGKPVIVIANKAEGRAADPGLMEAYSLGFGGALVWLCGGFEGALGCLLVA